MEIERTLNPFTVREDFVSDGRPGVERKRLDEIARLRAMITDGRSAAAEVVIRAAIQWRLGNAAWATTGKTRRRHLAAQQEERARIIDGPVLGIDEPLAVTWRCAVIRMAKRRDPKLLARLLTTLDELVEKGNYPSLMGRARSRRSEIRELALEAARPINERIWGVVREAGRPRDEYRDILPDVRLLEQLSPGHWAHLSTVGIAYYRARLYEESVATLEQAAAAQGDGGEAQALFYLAMGHARLGHGEAAEAAFARAVGWQLTHADQVAQTEEDLRLLEGAAEELLAARLGGEGRGARYRAAWASFEKGATWALLLDPEREVAEYEETLRRLRQIEAMGSGAARVALPLALALHRVGRSQEAIAALETAGDSLPDELKPAGSYVRALCYARLKDAHEMRLRYYLARDRQERASEQADDVREDLDALRVETERELSAALGETDWDLVWREGWRPFNKDSVWDVVRVPGGEQAAYEEAYARALREHAALPAAIARQAVLGAAMYRTGRYDEARALLEASVFGGIAGWCGATALVYAMCCLRLDDIERAKTPYVVARDGLLTNDPGDALREAVEQLRLEVDALAREIDGEEDWDQRYREGWRKFTEGNVWLVPLSPTLHAPSSRRPCDWPGWRTTPARCTSRLP